VAETGGRKSPEDLAKGPIAKQAISEQKTMRNKNEWKPIGLMVVAECSIAMGVQYGRCKIKRICLIPVWSEVVNTHSPLGYVPVRARLRVAAGTTRS
jgi:hypothetical protein